MRGITFGIAGTLLAMAAAQPASAQTANQCPFVKAAEISVIPAIAPIRYDISKTLRQLQQAKIDTINPYAFEGVSVTQAYTDGVISVKPSVKLGNLTDRNTGVTCIWYDKISLPIQITPTIVIAQEVYNDPCMRNAVINHEMKHVNVDKRVVNAFAREIGAKLYNTLKEHGFRAQPVPYQNAQAMADRMYQVVNQTVEFEYKKLDLVRTEQQQAVDSLEEYQRMSGVCPEFTQKLPLFAASKGAPQPSDPHMYTPNR